MNIEKISARSFFEVWNEIVIENKEILLKDWQNYKLFTNLIKGNDNSILSKIAKRLSLKVYERDYYSIDAIFYREEDLCPKIINETLWFRNLQIAFEHENNFYSGLYQEISHLLITNSSLKVLVTYPDDIESGENELNYFSEIIKGNRKEIEFSQNEEILVIYGYGNDYVWNGYIYNSEKWIKI